MTHHDHPADLSLEEYLVGGRSSYVKLPTIALSDGTEIAPPTGRRSSPSTSTPVEMWRRSSARSPGCCRASR
jgi:hypothetical protein